MNFARIEPTAAQRELAEDVVGVLAERWTPDPWVLSLDHERPPRAVMEALAQRGWVHPQAPPDRGGAGLGPVEARLIELLFDELRLPTYANEMILPTLRRHGSARLQELVLPDLESGRSTFCLGFTEPDSGSDMAAARTRAVRVGDDWVIDGTKMFTTWAESADYVFLLARTGELADKHGGLTLFLVPMDTPGIEARPIFAMGGVRTNVTYYREVPVPDMYRLGEVGAGWRVVSEPLATEHGVTAPSLVDDLNGDMGKASTRVLEALVERFVSWAARPEVAGGSPPLEDPSVRLAVLDALQDIEVCWSVPSSYGKVVAAEALQRHADTLLGLAGPAGLLGPGEPGGAVDGILAWARTFAPATDVYGGTSEVYRNNIARQGLGLPRPR
ncbi:acyl-CoA dehydrogenase family protein [Pseudonocardia xishanensis]|uniref:Acyl-CoA dehydrogenase family protein n=1 Tax=Pseudonocardia xishanensis TaxID=630995 RepID=A0ABP8S2L9_9PSEU